MRIAMRTAPLWRNRTASRPMPVCMACVFIVTVMNAPTAGTKKKLGADPDEHEHGGQHREPSWELEALARRDRRGRLRSVAWVGRCWQGGRAGRRGHAAIVALSERRGIIPCGRSANQPRDLSTGNPDSSPQDKRAGTV